MRPAKAYMCARWERGHAAELIPDPFFECCAKRSCVQLLLMDHRPFVQEIYAPLLTLSAQLQSHWKKKRGARASVSLPRESRDSGKQFPIRFPGAGGGYGRGCACGSGSSRSKSLVTKSLRSLRLLKVRSATGLIAAKRGCFLTWGFLIFRGLYLPCRLCRSTFFWWNSRAAIGAPNRITYGP